MESNELKNHVKMHWNKYPMDYDHIKSKKNSKDYYSEINNQFASVCYFGQKKNQRIFSSLIPHKNLKNKKVLIIGCGMGTLTKEFVMRGANVTAVDLTKTAVNNTKRQLKISKLIGKTLVADAENLPFKEKSFDFIWSWGVIHHTPDTQKAAKEIYRVLKTGGESRIMVYHKNSLFYKVILIGIRGIFLGELFKNKRKNLLNKYTDHSTVGGTPLAKCYTKKEAKRLFSKFKKIKFETYGVKNEVTFIPLFREKLHKLIPDWFFNLILSKLNLGWYLFIKLKK